MNDSPMRADTPETADKRAALRRMRFYATAALVLCVMVLLAARALTPQYPALSFLAAFAEAAAIGGLADWYAVTALFRRPLGLPIPHTAIVPRNRERIAENLGRFIETNFLAPAPVEAKLREVDFAALVAGWLSEPARSQGLSRFVARLLPQMLRAAEGTGLRDLAVRRVTGRLETIEVAPLVAGMLSAFTSDRRHQQLLDEMLKLLGRLLEDEAAHDAIRDRIRQELPSVAKFFRADAYLLRRIVASTASLMQEVREDQDHPIRHEFDGFAERFLAGLRRSPAFMARAEKLKTDLLASPQLRSVADEVWKGLVELAEKEAEDDNSAVRRQLGELFVAVGRQLAADPAMRADMNEGFVTALAAFVENQKSGVSTFISDQVRSWDMGQLVDLIEVNIGRDLQYIRFNGMIIGGCAGLLLHIGERLIFH